MEKPKSEYPTREELAEVLELRKQHGKEGIRMFLRKQRAKRKAEASEDPSKTGQ